MFEVSRKFGALRSLLLIGAIAASRYAPAQDLEPRSYSNTPVGMNFVLAGYGYTDGEVLTDPTIPLENAEVSVHGAVAAWVRSLGVLGKSAKLSVIAPYAWASGSAESNGVLFEREVSGFADPRFRFSINFAGAPALTAAEFGDYRQDLIAGAALTISAPLGQYDPDRLLNIGTNRWFIRPELGVSKAWGAWVLEASGGVTLYSENPDFFGGNVRAQDPVYFAQGHAIYGFRNGVWAALNATYYRGGNSALNGIEGQSLQKNSRIGATLAVPLGRAHSLKFYASTGVSVRAGSDFDAVGVAWQYRWGGR